MTIMMNGESYEFDGVTLSDLLAELQLINARIAVAVNGDFVCSAERNTLVVEAGDKVEIVAPQAGG